MPWLPKGTVVFAALEDMVAGLRDRYIAKGPKHILMFTFSLWNLIYDSIALWSFPHKRMFSVEPDPGRILPYRPCPQVMEGLLLIFTVFHKPTNKLTLLL